SSRDEPFTEYELNARTNRFLELFGGMGSSIPERFSYKSQNTDPISPGQITISHLLAAGAHLGNNTEIFKKSMQPFIRGERAGLYIIDLEKTLTHLRRAAGVVRDVAQAGGLIVFVNSDELTRPHVAKAASLSRSPVISDRWIPGTLTNPRVFEGMQNVVKLSMSDNVLSTLSSTEHPAKPDVVIFFNTINNKTALRECASMNVPTIGIVDTDCEPGLVSYPIPANDDSVRAIQLIAGALGKAAQEGVEQRLS
ncbi:hypothetical protein CANCADRAFT_15548, partial [Tortispora caseinolytica NRRL Y-17796]